MCIFNSQKGNDSKLYPSVVDCGGIQRGHNIARPAILGRSHVWNADFADTKYATILLKVNTLEIAP